MLVSMMTGITQDKPDDIIFIVVPLLGGGEI